MLQSVEGMMLIAALFACLVTALRFSYRFVPVSAEYERKLLHIAMGVSLFPLPWLLHSPWLVALMLNLIIFGRKIIQLTPITRKIFGRAYDVKRRSIGAAAFGVAFLLLFFLGEHNKLNYIIAASIVIFADSAAAMVGYKKDYGAFYIFGNKKTLSGSMAFFVVASLCVFPTLYYGTSMMLASIIVITLVVASTSTVVEALSPFGLDNFTVPIIVFYLLKLLL